MLLSSWIFTLFFHFLEQTFTWEQSGNEENRVNLQFKCNELEILTTTWWILFVHSSTEVDEENTMKSSIWMQRARSSFYDTMNLPEVIHDKDQGVWIHGCIIFNLFIQKIWSVEIGYKILLNCIFQYFSCLMCNEMNTISIKWRKIVTPNEEFTRTDSCTGTYLSGSLTFHEI